MPTVSWISLATGARQLVVHEALETTWWTDLSYLLEVDAQGDGDVLAGRRCRDQDLLAPPARCLAALVTLGEEAGRLDHDVDAELAPRQGGRVALGEHLQLDPPIDQEPPARR